MKIFVVLAVLASVTFAQSIAIGAPTAGNTVSPGSNLTVEIDQPNSLTGSTEVAIVIAMRSCYDNVCTSPADAMGSILYNGAFDPQYSTAPGSTGKPPHQNFTVTVPSNMQSGRAILSVTHLSLVGAGPFPLFEIMNTTLTVN